VSILVNMARESPKQAFLPNQEVIVLPGSRWACFLDLFKSQVG